jgi:hypothetical protein
MTKSPKHRRPNPRRKLVGVIARWAEKKAKQASQAQQPEPRG